MKHYKTPRLSVVELIEEDVLTLSDGSDMTGYDVHIGDSNPWGGN